MINEISHNFSKLEACVSRISSGPWCFIQLRGAVIGAGSIDGDDVDLLGTHDSVEALTAAVFAWSRAGECHFRIVSRDRYKTCLTLISLDGLHRLDLDLWIELWQIENRTRCLSYGQCEPLVLATTSSIKRFQIATEAAIYIHHLVSKRKNIGGASSQDRLASYEAACRSDGRIHLADALKDILSSGRIEANTLEEFRAVLPPSSRPTARAMEKISAKFAATWLAGPREISLVSVIGCDGAGKTTLARRLVEDKLGVREVLTGKHLYRKSWLYKLTVIFIRPLLFQNREKYDETLAPLVYLRACVGLQIKLWKHREGLRLIDRSILDFLMVDRKSDVPRFSKFHGLTRFFGRRIPVFHCVLPYSKVMERKNEVTEAGHDAYDTGMFLNLSRRIPTDYIVFNNSGGLEESVAAAGEILASIKSSD